MEVFDGVDLDDLPSNAFDSSLSDDEFSSWPSEGSPDPLDRDDESMDLSDEGAEDEYGDYEDYDEHGGHDWEENEDHHSDEYHEHSGSEYGGGEIEFMFDGENEVLQEDEDREGEGFRDLEGGFDDNDDQPSPRPHLPDRRSVAELFTGFQPRHQPTRSAFPPGSRPDSPPANILPPIDTILSSLGLGAMPEMESRRRQSLRSPGQERIPVGRADG
ncbi:uncharacterized protein THITE_2131298 [Thermothielavioides terrestris NRRL 8126]|uniref:Uncharacterized protein n=1 Tax=Thermothielavioides terrestris (strain ATCC 38088 / NRRL 8126) TaxID=578455 RepID=G2RAI2_THETT|nr:uncharacterized protein THITE_2131298 [Thermothielavioides terrestris NRRL 8126]AEO69717.1 hypothetical protein THITE_2131298 [Thermothielavioides terrestris NRRL 8126]